jgi:PKHD-type hydroxylase
MLGCSDALLWRFGFQLRHSSDLADSASSCSVWLRRRAFSARECREVLALAGALPLQVGLEEDLAPGFRRAQVAWIKPTAGSHWLFSKTERLFAAAQQEFGFDLDGLVEPIQYTRYGPGGFLEWHMDLIPDGSLVRKLSLSVQLTQPDEYQGGELEFFGSDACEDFRAQGAAVLFPSYLMHRVSRVLAGTRHALVAWAYGSRFR